MKQVDGVVQALERARKLQWIDVPRKRSPASSDSYAHFPRAWLVRPEGQQRIDSPLPFIDQPTRSLLVSNLTLLLQLIVILD